MYPGQSSSSYGQQPNQNSGYYPPPVPMNTGYQPTGYQPPIYPPPGPPPPAIQPTSGYTSPCHGKRKALLIGINYFGQRNALRGCINDVKNLRQFLIERYGFSSAADSMVVLTDDQQDPNFLPTYHNIINAMKWLVGGAQYGDSLFLHYSGHGGTIKDQDGDEADGYDETIIPLDYKKYGEIRDDDLNAIMVRCLPPGVRMTAIFDSCHSGTVLDLPYVYNPDGSLKPHTVKDELGYSAKDAAMNLMRGNKFGAAFKMVKGIAAAMNVDKANAYTQQSRSTMADVVLFSGCKDRQTSVDTQIQGFGNTGAMSFAFITALQRAPYPTYGQLLGEIRSILRQYSQIPQISSGRPMDMNQPFIL